MGAWVAERVGGKRLNGEELKTRGDVEQAMHFWADTAAYRLCTPRQEGNKCGQPGM